MTKIGMNHKNGWIFIYATEEVVKEILGKDASVLEFASASKYDVEDATDFFGDFNPKEDNWVVLSPDYNELYDIAKKYMEEN